jgi:hypothetical protein
MINLTPFSDVTDFFSCSIAARAKARLLYPSNPFRSQYVSQSPDQSPNSAKQRLSHKISD